MGSQQKEDPKEQQIMPSNNNCNNNNNKNRPELPKNTTHMVVPNPRGISESVKNICNKHGTQVYFKGGRTMQNILVAPKLMASSPRRAGCSTDTSILG